MHTKNNVKIQASVQGALHTYGPSSTGTESAVSIKSVKKNPY